MKVDTHKRDHLVGWLKFKGHNHLAMFGFRISIQYPSGSVMNAMPFILPAENGEQNKSSQSIRL